jgi:CBS domain-containing protein
MQVADILNTKGSEVYRITPDALVFDAVSALAARNVGALLVVDGDELVGIISERDYRNKVILRGRTSKETQVKEIMTSELIWVGPEESVERCLNIMTRQRIRHLPVLGEDHKILGIISIGDLVKSVIEEKETEIGELKKYIWGGYPG